MSDKPLLPVESVISKILVMRNQKVILDRDLANLYNVETRSLKQAVRRNIKRFPEDFMFQLTKEEFMNWRSQTVMSTSDQKGLRYFPFAFTEQGVAMLSSVLKSERAIEVNILIMRAFVRLREIISTHKKVEEKLREIDSNLKDHDDKILQIMQVINQLINPPEPVKKKIGFSID
jgi:phage regulator Rha-like protein